MGGLVWKFRMESLEKFTVKEGTQWKPKDSAQTPQVAPDMLTFLNRAQQLVTAMYSQSANQPGFAYTLRPKLDSAFKDSALELNVDGQSHVWNSVLQKQFTWPAAPGTKAGATARIRTVNSIVALPFASRDGVWGIFRVMGDAEPRVLLNPTVEWVNSNVNGSLIPIQPVPVRVEFADFPGGVDIFNPQFFSGLQCPLKAVQ
jgi:type VI protein secretion system component VasK